MRRIILNGEQKEFPRIRVTTLSELLNELEVEAATVVAEVDGNIVERNRFAQTMIQDGQNIELVRFVPGG